MTYFHELADWPRFRWDHEILAADLSRVHRLQGRLAGQMESLGFGAREESVLQTLTEEVVKSSEIEGERLDRDQVRSSIARRLGMDAAGLVPSDRSVDGVVEMTLDAVQNYEAPLTPDRLFGWHAALFPTGRSGIKRITVGNWRNDASGPMQVVSGPIGREAIHFEAPAADRLSAEMDSFLDWFESEKHTDPLLDAAIAHLWLVTIHPFDDGNGRIARAVTDLALARSDKSSQRPFSMSSQIRAERAKYYEVLEATQKGDLDVTRWLKWFLGCIEAAIAQAEETLRSVLEKANFWQQISTVSVNERQRKVLNRLLDGFEGRLTLSRWASITHTSKATAGRDLNDLVRKGVLVSVGAGRSTSYELAR